MVRRARALGNQWVSAGGAGAGPWHWSGSLCAADRSPPAARAWPPPLQVRPRAGPRDRA